MVSWPAIMTPIPARRHPLSCILILFLISAVLVFIGYLEPQRFNTKMNLEPSLLSHSISAFNMTINEMLTFSIKSTRFNFSEDFHRQKSERPEIPSHYPDEAERHY